MLFAGFGVVSANNARNFLLVALVNRILSLGLRRFVAINASMSVTRLRAHPETVGVGVPMTACVWRRKGIRP
jgi:hypothetical protein